MREDVGSLSKTTKLLLLDSLLQEVCIESGSDGSLALSSLGLSVCLVSHNLLYSGLKKAHFNMEIRLHNEYIVKGLCLGVQSIVHLHRSSRWLLGILWENPLHMVKATYHGKNHGIWISPCNGLSHGTG